MATNMVSYDNIPGLQDVQSWAAPEDLELLKVLIDNGQTHLFDHWRAGTDEDKKREFFKQVKTLDSNYPGGIATYVKNSRRLLRESAESVNPFQGMTPEVPDGLKLDFGSDDYRRLEEIGIRAFRDCAFVLVAGGLGERLGYTDIKISLPVESITERTYIELYIQQILSFQKASNDLTPDQPPRVCPLAIMTSDDTHDRTLEVLEKNNYFGAAPGQVTLMKQEKVAALMDNEARFAVCEKNPYLVDTKPHGHGDVHTLLASTGLAKKWQSEGFRFITFFQDTNSLCFNIIAATIGASIEKGFDVNSVTCPRKAKEAVGAITKLVKDDGSSITVNVEYNQLEPMLLASGFPEGDVNGPDGFSPFPGNINQLVFTVDPYVKVLDSTGGLVPEFVNPKYADDSKTKFIKPTRLECMMQDLPKLLGPEVKVGFAQFPEWTYSPVKNNNEVAVKHFQAGVKGRSAPEGEFEYYSANCQFLQAVGVKLPETVPFNVLGFTLQATPKVVLYPDFALSLNKLAKSFPNPSQIKMSSTSALIVEGDDVVIKEMDLDGALHIKVSPGTKVVFDKIQVKNNGVEFRVLEDVTSVPTWKAIRGFEVNKKDMYVSEHTTPGEIVTSIIQ